MPLRHETMSVQLQSDNSNQHPHDTHGPDIHASVIHVGIVCHCQDDCGISELTPAQERSHAPVAFGIGYLVPAGREARGGPGKPAGSTAVEGKHVFQPKFQINFLILQFIHLNIEF